MRSTLKWKVAMAKGVAGIGLVFVFQNYTYRLLFTLAEIGPWLTGRLGRKGEASR